MSKVAIVGVEGSGKTVLMAGLCECFKQVPGSDEPYLMPENKAAHMFMMQVPHKLRVKREWPAATNIDGLRSMKWTLRKGQQVIEEIEMLDYPGELYRLAFDDEARPSEIEAKRSELNEFLGHLSEAKVLVVLMNLSDLENPGENARNAETIWMTRKIFDYAKRLPNLERKMLVFTQADRYEKQLKAAGGPKALYARDLPMMHVLHPHLMVTAVSAVNQVDALNRPTEGYSSQSCIKLMELILNDSTLSIEPGSVRMIKLQEDSYLEFVWCPRGAFLMGSPETEPGRAPDEKQHSVTLTKGFFIGKYPITQKQWELITNSNPSVNKVGGFLGVGCQTQPNHPVENVSYADCIHFCEGVNKRLEACSVRLPTEAEWEYACRAGTTTAYAGKCEEMAWFSENSNDSTQKVGRKKPNSWGIHDMHGNVWEWCQDCYSEDYPLNTVDPLNISKQEFYVLRGGSYWSKMENCRSAVRYKGGKFSGEQWRGLRLVLVLK